MNRPRTLQQSLAATLDGVRVLHLLDAACGDGMATARLLRAGVHIDAVTAVDRELPASFDRSAEVAEFSFVHSDLRRWLESSRNGTGATAEPDACVIASALHHLPHFDQILARIAALLPRLLIVWEPLRCDGCPCAVLHEVKAEVDRAVGLWHRRPYTYDVVVRVLDWLRSFGVEWWHMEVVEPRSEELSSAEIAGAIGRTEQYLHLVQDRQALYAALVRRLRRTAIWRGGCRGEPHLLAIGTMREKAGAEQSAATLSSLDTAPVTTAPVTPRPRCAGVL